MSNATSNSRLGPAAVSGAVAGAVAWVLGYAVTYLAASERVQDALTDLNAFVGLVGGNEVPTWKAVGWLYLNAHMVSVRVLGAPGGPRTYDLLAESESGNAALLYLVPPLAILLVTAAAMWLVGVRDLVSGAIGGASAVVGYGVVTAAVAIVSRHALGAGIEAFSPLPNAVVLAGVVYPVVCGSVAGALVGLVRS
ncbi:SoxR reducing system RseC family protein [Halomarina salina]|uniref:SoxR reducing system RseC family protein n=1 Tax=Halomarina salina TaxID=1872699 RepID=A0ABD5RN45_9EURY|nr:SoxR reducing system RseC family protein [Halomarina salina]